MGSEMCIRDREKFKINARKRAEDFDIHKIVPLYEEVYKGLS